MIYRHIVFQIRDEKTHNAINQLKEAGLDIDTYGKCNKSHLYRVIFDAGLAALALERLGQADGST